jgi:hypothetical protein
MSVVVFSSSWVDPEATFGANVRDESLNRSFAKHEIVLSLTKRVPQRHRVRLKMLDVLGRGESHLQVESYFLLPVSSYSGC